MKVLSMEELILKTVATIMSKGKTCLFGALEPDGTMQVQAGTSKRKAQYIKTQWCIPHEVIDVKKKDDISVITHAFIAPIAGVHPLHLSERGKELRSLADSGYKEALEKTPRLKAALEELMEAIKEEVKSSAKTKLE